MSETDVTQGEYRLDVDALVASAAEMRVEAAAWLDVGVDDDGVRGAFSMLELQARELEAIALAQRAKDFGDEMLSEVCAAVRSVAEAALDGSGRSSGYRVGLAEGKARSRILALCEGSRAVQGEIARRAIQVEARSGRSVVVVRDEDGRTVGGEIEEVDG